jgi:hypothetical protein
MGFVLLAGYDFLYVVDIASVLTGPVTTLTRAVLPPPIRSLGASVSRFIDPVFRMGGASDPEPAAAAAAAAAVTPPSESVLQRLQTALSSPQGSLALMRVSLYAVLTAVAVLVRAVATGGRFNPGPGACVFRLARRGSCACQN